MKTKIIVEKSEAHKDLIDITQIWLQFQLQYTIIIIEILYKS